ncbi:uncharacterized protein LOC128983327 [Macrosteles quadrilineatus]|uniref:uncharacterized protein LOC128983327 n=1 Tax=Macrosteles quadrilineatus TaxID=74068 RepID=UPI0023E133A8|nr:uncharacterized protein LOC128983327 [Macrosteles quadrilineatus]
MKEDLQTDTQEVNTTDKENNGKSIKLSTVESFTISEENAYGICDSDKGQASDQSQPLGESSAHSGTPQMPEKKKQRKEKDKKIRSLGFQPLDAKRKTKKMVDMLDFLERERNVSLLDDICRSYGFNKKSKKNPQPLEKQCSYSTSSPVNFPSRSELVDPCDVDSIGVSPNQGCISKPYLNVKDSEEDTNIKSISDNDVDIRKMVTPPKDDNSDSHSSNDTKSNPGVDYFEGRMQLEECGGTEFYPAIAIGEDKIETDYNLKCTFEDNESPVLNLKISSIEDEWIDPDGYTSDESILVIDEGIDTYNTNTQETGKETIPETTRQQENNAHVNVDTKEVNISSTPNGDRTSEQNKLSFSRNNYPFTAKSSMRNEESKMVKERIQYTKLRDNYTSEGQDDKANQRGSSLQNQSLTEGHLVRKIKLKKLDKKDESYRPICNDQDQRSSSAKCIENTQSLELKYYPTDSKANREIDIIDVDNYTEAEKEFSKSKSPENIRLKSSEQQVSSSDMGLNDSTKMNLEMSGNKQQKSTTQNKYSVLQRHLELGNLAERYSIPMYPRTSRRSHSRTESCHVKPSANNANISFTNLETESNFASHSDIFTQNPLGEFNKVIYVLYRELLTPHSQNTIGQLTEILFLVVSESVRYFNRCRKAKRMNSAELVVREEVLAHRDFQANTIFYGMYFTHLFKNVVQCFPTTKEFHTFMYLALFVNLFRKLKSVYNVHTSYLHMARKLIVSMLKANMYEDITVFSAVCKPDPVFETDFILVSQLIDSFVEYIKTPEMDFLPQDNYPVFSQLSDLQQPSTSGFSRNLTHPEFPSVRVTVGPMPNFTSQSTKTQTHQTKSLEETNTQGCLRIHSKPKHNTRRDQQTYSQSDLESLATNRKPRLPNILIPENNPMFQLSSQIPTMSPFSSEALTTPGHQTSSYSGPRITPNLAMPDPADSNMSNTKTSTRLYGHNHCRSSGVHLWRPTALRPRFRPGLPYYLPPLFLNPSIPSPALGANCL